MFKSREEKKKMLQRVRSLSQRQRRQSKRAWRPGVFAREAGISGVKYC